jgi:hypothetical protein
MGYRFLQLPRRLPNEDGLMPTPRAVIERLFPDGTNDGVNGCEDFPY